MKLEELARLAGVSKATASIILNGHAEQYRISKDTQERVTSLAKKYHYHSDDQTVGNHPHGSRLVALILPELVDRENAEYARALNQHLNSKGFHLLVCCTEENTAQESTALSTLAALQVDAMITVSCHNSDEAYRRSIPQQTPVIVMSRKLPGSHYSFVGSNDRDSSHQLASLLIKDQQRPPLYLGGNADRFNSHERLEGYKQALSEANVQIDDDCIIQGSCTSEAGYDVMATYVNHYSCLPERLLTTSFSLMEGAIRYLNKHSATLPEHPAWATFGDGLILDRLPFPVHSAALDVRAMAEGTTQTLLRQLSGEPIQPASVIPRTVIKRRRKNVDHSASVDDHTTTEEPCSESGT